MARSLVLDIDRVLLRDPLLREHVRHNVVKYVQAKLPHAKDPARVNRILNKYYGHTSAGLETAFHIDTSDFDSQVYNPPLMEHLWEILSSNEFQDDAEIINDLAHQNWDVTLLSDAPLVWSRPVLSAVGDRVKLIPKLDKLAYPQKHHLFVDGALPNLRAVRDAPNWTPVHFRPDIIKDPNFVPEFPTIGSIWELGIMCASSL